MGCSRYRFSMAVFEERFVYVIGGQDSGMMRAGDTVERYDSVRNMVEEMPALNQARTFCSSCAVGDAIYVFCGLNDS